MLYMVGLEPYRERYTTQLDGPNGWWDRNLSRAGVDFKRIDGPLFGNDQFVTVETGVVLDPKRRTEWAFKQTLQLIDLAVMGKITDKDVIYFSDLWHPGFEQLPYTFHQLGVKPKMYAFCHAQSVDEFDFTYPMRGWMRHFERGIGEVLDGVFVSCPSMGFKLAEVVHIGKIHACGHVWSTEEVMERMPKFRGQFPRPEKAGHSRLNQVVFSSRWDREKNPKFFLDVANRVRMRMPDARFVVTTSAPKVRSNDPNLLHELEIAKDFGTVEVREDQTKEQYYATLCESKVQFNCLSGDTLVLTRNGAEPIRKIIGRRELMTERGKWVESEVRSYGKQQTYSLTFGRGSNSTFTVKATASHRWFLANGRTKTSLELTHGDLIAQVAVRPSIDNEQDYLRGVQHGIVFGDGTRHNDTGYVVRLCGHKKELLRFFEDYPHSYPPSSGGDPHVYIRGSDSWCDLKQAPSQYTGTYLLGFFRGWLATDGSMSGTAHSFSLSGSLKYIEWAHKHAAIVGWHPGGLQRHPPRETDYGMSSTVSVGFYSDTIWDDDLLLRCRAAKLLNTPSRSRSYVFKSCKVSGEEEVFCASVPETHNFALWNGMLTGNCSDQDWVSYVLLEASVAGCYPVYPNFRSFPETFLGDFGKAYLYEHQNVQSATDKVLEVLNSTVPLWSPKAIQSRSWIHRRFDSTWLRMLAVMGGGPNGPRLSSKLPEAEWRDETKDPFDPEVW